MKRKQKAPKAAPAAQQTAPAAPETVPTPSPAEPAKQPLCAPAEALPALEKKDRLSVVLFALLLFLAMTVQTGRMSLILVVIALVCAIGKKPLATLRSHASLPVFGFAALMLLSGFAAIYSHFGSYAVTEFNKFLAVGAVGTILLSRFEKTHTPALLWAFAAVSAAIGLLCIDGAVSGPLFRGVNAFVQLLGDDLSSACDNAWGSRIAGIYNDANVTGCLLGVGTCLSLYLTHSRSAQRPRLLASLLLGVNAMAFFLSMSRGAILCFAITMLVWLAAEPRESRLPLFLRMLVSALVVIALSVPGMKAVVAQSMLVTLLSVLAGLVIAALDRLLCARLCGKLSGHGKTLTAILAVLVAAVTVYAVAATHISGPYTFDRQGILVRSVYPQPDQKITLTADADEGVRLIVTFRNEMDRIKGTGTQLYDGPLDSGITFTVPGEEGQVGLEFQAAPGTQLREVQLSSSDQVRLNYPLLPGFVANRLQDQLLSSNSFTMRVQYVKDGLTLFAQSPLLGHGLGSTEGLLTSVQPFFYESLYVHNHLLQFMDDMGLLGLAAFLLLLGGGLWLIIRAMKKERSGLAAALLACFFLMNLHSLMEISFSVRGFACYAYAVLLLPVLIWGQPLKKKAARTAGTLCAAVLWCFLAVFGGLMESHRMVQRSSIETNDIHEFLDFIQGRVSRDVFDREQNQLDFVANALQLNDPVYNGTMLKYAAELRTSGTYPACSGLARYFYLPQGKLEEMFAVSREGIRQEASAHEAWDLQFDFYRTDVLSVMQPEQMEAYLQGVLETGDALKALNEDRIEAVELSEENQKFLAAVENVSQLPDTDGKSQLILLRMQSGRTSSGE